MNAELNASKFSRWLRREDVPSFLRAAREWSEEGWEGFFAAARERDAVGAADALLREAGAEALVPAAARERWDTLRRGRVARTARLLEAFEEAARAFSKARVPVVALKGVYLAQEVYADPAFRPFHDVDVLCRRSDLPRAMEVFGRLGYRPPEVKFRRWIERCYFEMPMVRDGGIPFRAEIHWDLAPHGRYAVDEEGVFERSLPWKGKFVRALAPEDVILHLAMHAAYSCFFMLPWSRWRDFGEALAKLRPDEEALLGRAKAWGARAALWGALTMASREAPAPEVEALLARIELPRWRRRSLEKRLALTMDDVGKAAPSLPFRPPRLEREALAWLTADSPARAAGSLARKAWKWLRHGPEPTALAHAFTLSCRDGKAGSP